MKNPLKSQLPAKLARGRERFEKWRSKHKKRIRLPEHLWSLAAELAREYGLNKTVQALGLDYNCLKKRIASPVSNICSQSISTTLPMDKRAQFLELLPSETNATLECTIECEDARGIRIRIHIKGRELPDLAALSSSLWSRNR